MGLLHVSSDFARDYLSKGTDCRWCNLADNCRPLVCVCVFVLLTTQHTHVIVDPPAHARAGLL